MRAYLAPSGASSKIHIREIATGATTALPPPTGNVNGNSIRNIESSPDDRFLVFSAGSVVSGYYAYVQSVAGGNPTKLQGAGAQRIAGPFAWRQ